MYSALWMKCTRLATKYTATRIQRCLGSCTRTSRPQSSSRGPLPPALVDDEELRAGARRGAMRLGAVGDLVAHAGAQRERAAVGELGVQLALEAKEDVPLLAPVVGGVARRVLHHAHAQRTELAGAPQRDAGFAGMLGRLDMGPIGGPERNSGHQHRLLLTRSATESARSP